MPAIVKCDSTKMVCKLNASLLWQWKLHLFELEQELKTDPLTKYVLYQVRSVAPSQSSNMNFIYDLQIFFTLSKLVRGYCQNANLEVKWYYAWNRLVELVQHGWFVSQHLDQLTPHAFIFVVAMEYLLRSLAHVAQRSDRHVGISLTKQGTPIPLLSFADDTIIFATTSS